MLSRLFSREVEPDAARRGLERYARVEPGTFAHVEDDRAIDRFTNTRAIRRGAFSLTTVGAIAFIAGAGALFGGDAKYVSVSNVPKVLQPTVQYLQTPVKPGFSTGYALWAMGFNIIAMGGLAGGLVSLTHVRSQGKRLRESLTPKAA